MPSNFGNSVRLLPYIRGVAAWTSEGWKMERIIQIHIEKLSEGVYLATSDDIQGLVAQGRTVSETLDIARDVARKLRESYRERRSSSHITEVTDSFDYPLVVSA